MNRVLKLGAAALLAVGLTVPAVAFARITLDVQPADKSVIFFHNRHTALACTMPQNPTQRLRLFLSGRLCPQAARLAMI